MAEPITPVRLQKAHLDQAAAVLARAFQADPAYVHLFPDKDERQRSLRALWSGVIAYSRVYGDVYTIPGVGGAACWLAPGKTESTVWRTLRTRLVLVRAVIKFNGDARRRFLAVLDSLDATHKQIMTRHHWYLWALGVDPDHQGKGLGSALIAPVLAQTDSTGTPCYLEAMTEANVRFYEKRGFEVVHEGTLPGEDLAFWAMKREPR